MQLLLLAPIHCINRYVVLLQDIKLQAHSCFTVMWHMLRDKMTTPVPSTRGSQFGLFDRCFAASESSVFCNTYCTFHNATAY